MENKIYTMEKFEEFLSKQPIGVEAVEAIKEFAQLLQNRCDFQTRRCNTAAQLLGHDLINECMED